MSEMLTLEELKARNAAESEVESEPEQVEEDTKVTIDAEPEPEETEEEVAEETETEQSEEVESWMQEGEEAAPSDDESGFKPNPAAAAVRKKLQAKLHDKDEELERVKRELEQLKSGSQSPAQAEKLPPRPKLEDFDYDEAKHEAALDDWYDKKAEAKAKSVFNSNQSEAEQKRQAEAAKKALEDATNRHYERAAKLVQEGKVSEERYAQSDRAVREAFDRVKPGNGDIIVDSLIKTLDSLGEGSEKVMYSLGVNPAKMQEVLNAFASDPSGLSAVAMLGKMQASITSPIKRKSSAPKPTPELQGSGGGKTAADKMRKQYQAAGSDLQKRIDLKRKAKREGIDTSNW